MKIFIIVGAYLVVTASSTNLFSYFTERADDVDDFCDLENVTKRYVFCDNPPDPIPEILKFPSNVMELEEVCLFFKTYAPCRMKWDIKCFNQIELHILNATLDSCKKDSTSYQSIEENIECLDETYRKYKEKEIPCGMEWEEVADVYEKFKETKNAYLFPQIHDKIEKSMPNFLCEPKLVFEVVAHFWYVAHYRWYFIDIGCFMNYLDLECPKVHDAVMEYIVKNYAYLGKPLKDHLEAGMLKILDNLDLENRQKAWTKESVKKFGDKCEEIDCIGWAAELEKQFYQ